ncbi:hypothetical protein GCM10010969_07760 [Saccharibacillus kuerlensis]|uniref:Uncharacterized protein n=1 Tax=Saccharibacillus kuerlensis TaxID=459527 RepID=A0ABQ2KV37_9BACL|nr:hypothetical protein GCM10010969_07760 [Saccharibacillus kuerlensis]
MTFFVTTPLPEIGDTDAGITVSVDVLTVEGAAAGAGFAVAAVEGAADGFVVAALEGAAAGFAVDAFEGEADGFAVTSFEEAVAGFAFEGAADGFDAAAAVFPETEADFLSYVT